jgi:phage tail-like protein
MADALPFTTFSFWVNLQLPGEDKVLCEAGFSDCDGLEMSMAPKTIREGGNNGRQIHLVGPVSYGQLTLKRGMTSDFGLWKWFERTQREHDLRASGEVEIRAPDRTRVDVRFSLTGCLPVKIKAPALSGKDGLIAIEEMQIVYETLALKVQ